MAVQKAKKGLITQREAAEIGRSERHLRRLLKRLKGKGDAVIVHGLRGRRSNRKIDVKVKQAAIKIRSEKVYSGFGPTLATEYLADKHNIRAGTLEQAHAYLEERFIPWWNEKVTLVSASLDEAHRPLAAAHSLPASLSYVETRQVANDYTIQFDNKIHLIARADIRAGLRGGAMRVEVRLDGSLAVRFRDVYVAVTECLARPKVETVHKSRKATAPRKKSQWMNDFRFTGQEKTALSVLPSASPVSATKRNR